MKLGDLIVSIGADTRNLNSALDSTHKKMRNFGSGMTKLGKQMTMSITAPVAIMSATAISAFDKQAKAVSQLEAGLKSTGGTVGYTSQELQKMASDLQKTTLFGDEEILQGATAQLLTFTNITGTQFARTQKAALDLATRLDGDLKGASIQLGKALNDPIANLSALSRSGIQFSSDQKAVIKSLVETGRLADAQTIILDELEKQYGGSAEAASRAGSGPLKQLQMAIGDLQEQFGEIIMEGIKPFISYLTGLVHSFQNTSRGTKTFITVAASLLAAIGPIMLVLPQLVQGFALMRVAILQGVVPALQRMMSFMIANPYLVVAAAIGALVYKMSDYVYFTEAADRAQKNFNKTISSAEAETAKAMVKVNQLADVVRNEAESEEKRLKALKALQAISPEYFGNLDLEKSKTEDLTTAVDAYKDSVLRAAKIKVLTQRLEELVATQEELKAEFAEGPSIMDRMIGLFGAAGAASAEMAKNFRISEEAGEVSEEIAMITAALAELNPTVEETAGNTNDLAGSIQDTSKEAKQAAIDLLAAQRAMDEFNQGVIDAATSTDNVDLNFAADSNFDVDALVNDDFFDIPVDETVDDLDTINQELQNYHDEQRNRMQNMMNFSQEFGATLGESFAGLMAGGEEADEALKGLAKNVIKSMLGIAKASVIANATQTATAAGPAALPLTPVLIAGGLSLIEGLIGAIAFADGGIVSGPTMGLVGEYAGARNNPEVIAPLDKLQSMLSMPGEQGGTLTSRVKGSDLIMVLDRAGHDVNRRR